MKFKLLIVFSLLISHGNAMEQAETDAPTKCYMVDGHAYDLHPERAVTFVWRDGMRIALSAQEVLKLNSAFIWASLRAQSYGFAPEHEIAADDFMTPSTCTLLSVLMQHCCLLHLNACSDRISKQECTAVRVQMSDLSSAFIAALSGKQVSALVAACDFLQARELLALIKEQLLYKYVTSIDRFGDKQDIPTALEMLSDMVTTPHDHCAINNHQLDMPRDIQPATFKKAKRMRYVRICGNQAYDVTDAQFLSDYRLVKTYEPGAPKNAYYVWQITQSMFFKWPFKDPHAQYLVVTFPDGGHLVWQLCEDFSDLTLTQRLLLKQALTCRLSNITPAHYAILKPIYQSLPTEISQLLPTQYRKGFGA